jgi:tetratricopeptide (TPR) repeat protein
MRSLVIGVILGLIVLMAPGRPAAAGTHVTKRKQGALKAAPAKTPARSAGQSQAAVQQILENIVTSIWTHADYYWHEGRYEDHVAICRFMMRADPGFPESYSAGGWLLENLGRNDEALAVYREGARRLPNDWRPLHDLGYFYFKQQRYPEAIETLQKATTLQPPTFVWHVLAHSYEKSGDIARSVETWRRCLELHPNDGAAGHNLRRLEGQRESDSADATEPE